MWSETVVGQRKSTTDRVARLAAAQHGVITAVQLADAGVGPGAVAHRLRDGGLHRIHRGVYCVGYMSATREARMMAAVLVCGEGAALSHRSAGALWRIVRDAPATIEVTVPSKRAPTGVVVHRATGVEITRRAGIPVTTLARTLADLAGVLDETSLVRAFNEARIVHRLSSRVLAREIESRPRRKGVWVLRKLIDADHAPTRSTFEDRFLEFVDRERLPRPAVNQRIAGLEVDMLWREQRLIVELDGRRFHDTGPAFERDRARDAQLLAAGYRVVRLTWRRLIDQPATEASRLRILLAP